MKTIILASKSPRRKVLLRQIGLDFIIVPGSVKEMLNPRLKPKGQAEYLSELKADTIYSTYKKKPNADYLIISADTIVAVDDEVLGKPKNNIDAKIMLKKLSGRRHQVITAYTLIDVKSRKKITNSEVTNVYFRKIKDSEIAKYIKSEKISDKAGAYAIQGRAAVFVEKIEGDYSNIVGLPLYSLARDLKKFAVNIL